MCVTYVEMQLLRPQKKSCFCSYVKLNVNNLSSIGTSLLKSVLSCEIQRYWIIGNHQKPVFKVKILESSLLTALTFGNQNGHHASIWHKKVIPPTSNDNSLHQSPSVFHPPWSHNSESINILSWNSRGLTSSVLYSYYV